MINAPSAELEPEERAVEPIHRMSAGPGVVFLCKRHLRHYLALKKC